MGAPIYLDVDDEITSAVTRIRAAGPGPVVLVLPFGSRLASSRINFRLLAREAAALGRELVVVAPEPAVRALAASAELTTYATILELEHADRPESSKARGGATSVRAGGSLRRGDEPGPGIVGGVPLPGPEAPEPGGGAGGQAGTQPPPQDARTVSLSDGRPAPRNLDVEATPRSATDAPPAIRARTPRRRTVFAVAGVGLIAVVAAVAVLAVVNLLPTATISITPTRIHWGRSSSRSLRTPMR